jgi:hypothetical protein
MMYAPCVCACACVCVNVCACVLRALRVGAFAPRVCLCARVRVCACTQAIARREASPGMLQSDPMYATVAVA